MNWLDNSCYRLKLAAGFLEEADKNMQSQMHRSCVDNCQLCIENSAKSVILCFSLLSKTHSPHIQLMEILKKKNMDDNIKKRIEDIISLSRQHGFEEHITSDYGDELTLKTPWEIFGKKEAEKALNDSRLAFKLASETVNEFLKIKNH